MNDREVVHSRRITSCSVSLFAPVMQKWPVPDALTTHVLLSELKSASSTCFVCVSTPMQIEIVQLSSSNHRSRVFQIIGFFLFFFLNQKE